MINEYLINQCINKERRALEQCYNACAPYVYSIVKSYFTNNEDRKDAMQEIFVNLFNYLHSYDSDKGKFNTWLSKLSVNQCITLLRKKNKLVNFVEYKEVKEIPDNEDEVLSNLSRQEINDLLESMPVGYKTIFLLRVIDEYDHSEIAELLDITKETSRSQLSRAIKWIKTNIIRETKEYIYG
jgi:RNA polymerase sigma-70 factor (ECF subfamily)